MSHSAPALRQAVFVRGTVGSESSFNAALQAAGFAPGRSVASVDELLVSLKTHSADLVMVPVGDGGASFQACAAELRRLPAVLAIATAPEAESAVVLTAMRAGITEFVSNPINARELQEAITRLFAQRATPATNGKIIAVYSAKGGVGTSTLAASLAYGLSDLAAPREVALADFNTAGTGLRVMLNLNPLYDLSSVAAQSNRMDREFLRSLMIQHVDRVDILAASDDLDSIESLTAAQASAVLTVLQEQYAYTVLDTDHHFTDQTLAAFDASDKILLVTQFDVAALRSTQRSLSLFAKLNYPSEKIQVVANRCTDFDRITPDGAERVLGRPILSRLPNDYFACSGASTEGQFLQRFDPKSPLVPAIRSMAEQLTGLVRPAPVALPVAPSRLRRLLGR